MRASRMFLVAVLVFSFVGVGAGRAAATYPPYSTFRVESSIRVHLVDGGGPLPDQHCAMEGRTKQYVASTASGPPTQLGEGRPQFEYPRDRGPFRDRAGTPVLFACGNTVSVCFHPSTVAVDLANRLTATVEVTLFEGSGLVMPCDPANRVSRQAVYLNSAIGRCAEPVTLAAPEGSSVTIESLCASTRWAGSAPAPMEISSLACFSFGGRFSCDIVLTGAVAPVTVRWAVDGINVPVFDDQPSMTGRCPAGTTRQVHVAVRDAPGNIAQRFEQVPCY